MVVVVGGWVGVGGWRTLGALPAVCFKFELHFLIITLSGLAELQSCRAWGGWGRVGVGG